MKTKFLRAQDAIFMLNYLDFVLVELTVLLRPVLSLLFFAIKNALLGLFWNDKNIRKITGFKVTNQLMVRLRCALEERALARDLFWFGRAKIEWRSKIGSSTTVGQRWFLGWDLWDGMGLESKLKKIPNLEWDWDLILNLGLVSKTHPNSIPKSSLQ